ncbi:MAG: 50S ribosomal protein L19 [Candidatus Sungbacteria bacterium]|uniref:Large ribosomal subunit protein bL19 n=1 Tax=Candidatus Sungiibacteriota bacterium TaxID=2750080 RepID=A0A931YE08_9BACT|nr:50S ribosomal protein L19 [Candidatus Sungbacteria bacterium]MBI2466135.1 50S ribosomal protein L19 [Candidatus Sungbacteria bacterium]
MLSAQDFIKIEYKSLKDNPALKAGFRVGDTVKVHQMIKEITTTKKNISKTAKKALEKSGGGDKGPVERIQVFEGIVIARKHGAEPGASFTVRKIAAGGVAVEKIYPLYSPTLKKIEVVSRPKVRRAKLYFLRNRTGVAARRLGVGAAVEAETDSAESKDESK